MLWEIDQEHKSREMKHNLNTYLSYISWGVEILGEYLEEIRESLPDHFAEKLSRLNWTVAVFEVETDAGGNVQEKFWEWK